VWVHSSYPHCNDCLNSTGIHTLNTTCHVGIYAHLNLALPWRRQPHVAPIRAAGTSVILEARAPSRSLLRSAAPVRYSPASAFVSLALDAPRMHAHTEEHACIARDGRKFPYMPRIDPANRAHASRARHLAIHVHTDCCALDLVYVQSFFLFFSGPIETWFVRPPISRAGAGAS
jgi:hypothetical protein